MSRTSLPWRFDDEFPEDLFDKEGNLIGEVFFANKDIKNYMLQACNNYKALQAENERLRQQLDETCHVIIEETDFPKNSHCKCEACKAVAKRMANAEWCTSVKDWWWEDTTSGS